MEPTTHQKAISLNRLIFAAMNETLHSTYLNAKQVEGFDKDLANKLRNIKAQMERQLKKDFLFIEAKGGKEALEFFYDLTDLFQGFIETAQKGDFLEFEKLALIMKAYREGDLELQEEKEPNQKGTG
jgi:hypothetical protein